MRYLKVLLLTSIFFVGSIGIIYADLEAFVKSETAYLKESKDYSSENLLQVKYGARLEIIDDEDPMKINANGAVGYLGKNHVDIYNVTQSGTVKALENITVNAPNGKVSIAKNTQLPVYDYVNQHYLVKYNGVFYYLHESLVTKLQTSKIVKPILVTNDIFHEQKESMNELNDLFAEMDATLSYYQDSLNEKNNPTEEKEDETDISFETEDFDLDDYMDIPIINAAAQELGKPYVWGAVGPSSYDCSGFTYSVYKKMGITIPRVSADQGANGTYVEKSQLQPGDLVFFDTRSSVNSEDITDNPNDTQGSQSFKPSKVTHVGMYIGNGYFIHASSGQKKVVIQDMTISYYKARYLWAKRYM